MRCNNTPDQHLSPFFREIPFKQLLINWKKFLGAGSTSDVFQGIWNKQKVAVKIFLPMKENVFSLEIKSLQTLMNENTPKSIVKCYGSGQMPNGISYIVMKHIQLGVLSEIIKHNDPLTWDECYTGIMDICAALLFLHDKKLIYRDLKLSNVLLKKKDNSKIKFKLCDFGSTKTEGEPDKSETGKTPWMPPEAYEKTPLTAKSDIYGLGKILWCLCAWQNDPMNPTEKLEVKAAWPQKLVMLIWWCTELSAENRPSAEEVEDELKLGINVISEKMTARYGAQYAAQFAKVDCSVLQHSSLAFREIPFEDLSIHKNNMLGSGSNSEVFQGTWHGKNVAIKIFRRSKARSFENETKKLQKLLDKNTPKSIVKYYGFGMTDNNQGYIVMKNIQSGDLCDVINNNDPISWEDCYACIKDICDALVFLHKKNLVHRDIKTLNVLLNAKRNQKLKFKLCDFGLIKAEGEPAKAEIGTAYWIAPEAFAAMQLSAKTDIYSFGKLLWCLCAWKRKPMNSPKEDCENAIPQSDKPSMEQQIEALLVKESWPKKMIMLLWWCTEFLPEHRPTINEIANELQSGINVISENLITRYGFQYDLEFLKENFSNPLPDRNRYRGKFFGAIPKSTVDAPTVRYPKAPGFAPKYHSVG